MGLCAVRSSEPALRSSGGAAMAAFGYLSVPHDSACRAAAQSVPRTWSAGGEAAMGGGQQSIYRSDGGISYCLAKTRQPEGSCGAVASELGRGSRNHGTGGGAGLGPTPGRSDSAVGGG